MNNLLPLFDFSKDPFENFRALFGNAERAVSKDPNAMTLATVGKDGTPSIRTVLFKGLKDDGLTFYTNYDSQKGKELNSNSKASLLFFWPTLEEQIRLTGYVEKMSHKDSEEYFKTRPRLSQIGAWASHQSEKISGLDELERRISDLEKKYAGKDVPCPSHWGGFVFIPLQFEFWFGRLGRLHERYVYERSQVGEAWTRYMKSP